MFSGNNIENPITAFANLPQGITFDNTHNSQILSSAQAVPSNIQQIFVRLPQIIPSDKKLYIEIGGIYYNFIAPTEAEINPNQITKIGIAK